MEFYRHHPNPKPQTPNLDTLPRHPTPTPYPDHCDRNLTQSLSSHPHHYPDHRPDCPPAVTRIVPVVGISCSYPPPPPHRPRSTARRRPPRPPTRIVPVVGITRPHRPRSSCPPPRPPTRIVPVVGIPSTRRPPRPHTSSRLLRSLPPWSATTRPRLPTIADYAHTFPCLQW